MRQTPEADLAPDQPPMTYELDIPLWHDKPPLTLNQRLHWRARAQRTRLIRDTTAWTARSLHIGPQHHITVQLHYHPGDNRRRDTDNLVPTQKPAIDGLVDAGVIPDDTPDHITWRAPTIHPGPGDRRLWITIQTP